LFKFFDLLSPTDMTQPIPPTPEGIPGSSNGAAKSPDAGDRKGIEERVGQAASQVPKPESAGRLALRIVSGIAVPNPKELKEKLKTMTFGALVRELQELRARGDLGFGVVAKMTGGRPAYEDMVQMYVDRINLLYSPIAVALGLSASPAPTETQVHQLLDRIEARDDDGRTELMRQIGTGDSDRVSQLIAWGADVNALSAPYGTPLMLAAIHGRAAIAKELLKAGARVDATTENNETALLSAVVSRQTAVVKMLLEAGATPNYIYSINKVPYHSPLDTAIVNRQAEIVELLLPHATQAIKDRALQRALRHGPVSLVLQLLELGAKPQPRRAPEAPGAVTETELMKAARSGDREKVIELLIQGELVNRATVGGETALKWAAWNGHRDVVDILLAAGADPTHQSITARLCAAAQGHLELEKYLESVEKLLSERDRAKER
jgi:ankyrin repeat protein